MIGKFYLTTQKGSIGLKGVRDLTIRPIYSAHCTLHCTVQSRTVQFSTVHGSKEMLF